MNREFSNVYDDQMRAEAYSKLEFPGTYFLAYRDLPSILLKHSQGTRALDFGCGTGRSTRFLRKIGFDPVVGVDIAEQMLAQARERDRRGEYLLVDDGDLGNLRSETYDVILSVFTFDNVPTMEKKVSLLGSLKQLLNSGGCIVSVVSSPEIYLNEWASFSTKNYPENRDAKSGDKVRIVMLDVEDRRPVEDVLWTEEDYNRVYEKAGLKTIEIYRPLASPKEPFAWVNETEIAPWTIYVLSRK